jgi:hypothetical protein
MAVSLKRNKCPTLELFQNTLIVKLLSNLKLLTIQEHWGTVHQ